MKLPSDQEVYRQALYQITMKQVYACLPYIHTYVPTCNNINKNIMKLCK
jgi:hypothetical protein